MARKGYTTVGIPTGLIKAVDAIVEKKKLSYKSRADYLNELIRRDLRMLIEDKIVGPHILKDENEN